MTRIGFGLLAALLVLGGAAIAYRMADGPSPAAPRAEANRPVLALLTSLPLLFGEQFSIEGGGSPALARIEQRYKVEPIAVADGASLKNHRLLLMAHPRAQPAEVLVELDAWVRAGGRLVLLADPRLEWESSRPLGDPLRPPPAFADTGLLAHWGLALAEAEAGEGAFRLTDNQCSLDQRSLIARCMIGKGRATIFADVDFVMRANDDNPEKHRFDLLMEELARFDPR